MDEDDIVYLGPDPSEAAPAATTTTGAPAAHVSPVTARTGRPWTVRLLEQVQSALLADKARFSIVKQMVDGDWHDLTSLWRVAKKQRPIGIVGVGMALNSVQESTGLSMFETGGTMTPDTASNGGEDLVDSSWKIKDEYMGILRAVVSTLDGGAGNAANASGLGSALGRVHVQRLNREGTLES